MDWSITPIDQVESRLNTSLNNGLTNKQVNSIFKLEGKNTQFSKKRHTIFDSIIKQIKDPVVYILFFAGIFTILIEHFGDFLVILVTLIINLLLGVIQEWKANSAFEKIKKLQEKEAIVIRDGKKEIIKAENLVRGDLILLKSGNFVPADIRLIESNELLVNESILTGEWQAQKKCAITLSSEKSIFDKINMAWQGTTIESGDGVGLVINVGKKTQFGSIAETLSEKKEETHLQKVTGKIAKFVTIIIIVAVIFILIIGIINNMDIFDVVILAISISVAAIPSGLPASVSFILALGMERILKKGGLVKNLLAAETLGGTTTIIVDKTGTLTKGKMEAVGLICPDGKYVGIKNTSLSEISEESNEIIVNAILGTHAEKLKIGSEDFVGSPIEKGISKVANDIGISREMIETKYKELFRIPFTAQRKASATITKNGSNVSSHIVGSPETIIENSRTMVDGSGIVVPITDEARKQLLDTLNEYTSHGGRVIAVSIRENMEYTEGVKKEAIDTYLEKLTKKGRFLGLVVFRDPIREDIKESVVAIKKAGINIIVATGDAVGTAIYVAKEVGIINENSNTLTGDEIEKISDESLYKKLKTTKIFARMTPKQKLRLLRTLSSNGEVVAMTGDGVNDVPTLHHAAIGIALGSGTDIAKDASDLILINNSFFVIVSAIQEGRRIISNLKRVLVYLISTSFSEIWLIGLSFIMGLPVPLLPSHILWANVVEESFISVAFAFEKKDVEQVKKWKTKNIFSKDVKN